MCNFSSSTCKKWAEKQLQIIKYTLSYEFSRPAFCWNHLVNLIKYDTSTKSFMALMFCSCSFSLNYWLKKMKKKKEEGENPHIHIIFHSASNTFYSSCYPFSMHTLCRLKCHLYQNMKTTHRKIPKNIVFIYTICILYHQPFITMMNAHHTPAVESFCSKYICVRSIHHH